MFAPVPYRLIETDHSDSFSSIDRFHTGLPIGNHVGAFGVKRKYHYHEGVDLYVPKSTPVSALCDGKIIAVSQFTGESVNLPHWNDTWAVFVDTAHGTMVYGEIAPHRRVGEFVKRGELIGVVLTVLKHNKGRPMSMLHFELHDNGVTYAPEWKEVKPKTLKDPTNLLKTLSLCED